MSDPAEIMKLAQLARRGSKKKSPSPVKTPQKVAEEKPILSPEMAESKMRLQEKLKQKRLSKQQAAQPVPVQTNSNILQRISAPPTTTTFQQDIEEQKKLNEDHLKSKQALEA
jgi:hypothetical protein